MNKFNSKQSNSYWFRHFYGLPKYYYSLVVLSRTICEFIPTLHLYYYGVDPKKHLWLSRFSTYISNLCWHFINVIQGCQLDDLFGKTYDTDYKKYVTDNLSESYHSNVEKVLHETMNVKYDFETNILRNR